MAAGRQAAQATTGTAVSAATYCRKTAVFFLRARQIMPGCTVAHSWKCGLYSTMSPPLGPARTAGLFVISAALSASLQVENSYESTAYKEETCTGQYR